MRLIAPRGVESGRWFPQTVSCSAGSAQVPDTLTDLIDSGSPNIDVHPFFNNVPHGSWHIHRPQTDRIAALVGRFKAGPDIVRFRRTRR